MLSIRTVSKTFIVDITNYVDITLFLLQSLGNHEFDNGVTGLTPFIESLNCPVLAANLILTKVPQLAQEANLKNSVVIDVDGHKIGIVGYLTPETKQLAVPNDVEYCDEIECIKKEVKKLQDDGINIIIALGHSGYLKDLEIAKSVDGVDLVIGGHTNTFLWNGTSPDSEEAAGPYPTYVTQDSGRSALVVQAYAYTKYLGKLHLVFDSNGEITHADGTPILLDNSIPQDPEVVKIVQKYKSSLLNITEAVLGYSSVVFDNSDCLIRECNLGNLITDALVYKYVVDYDGEHWTDAPIAIVQGGGIRAGIAHATMPANITKGDLLTVMPFEGKAVTVTVNGSILLQILEHSVARYDVLLRPGEFLQYSGIKVTYDLSKPPGSRVVTAEARCWACGVPTFSKITEKDIFKVIMPHFVSIGGDGYTMVVDMPKQWLDFNELSATQFYVSRHSPIYPQLEGRITFIDSTQSGSSSCIFSLSLFLIIFALTCNLVVVQY